MNRQRKALAFIRLLEDEDIELEFIYERIKLCFTDISPQREEAASRQRALKAISDARQRLEAARAELNGIAQRDHTRRRT